MFGHFLLRKDAQKAWWPAIHKVAFRKYPDKLPSTAGMQWTYFDTVLWAPYNGAGEVAEVTPKFVLSRMEWMKRGRSSQSNLSSVECCGVDEEKR